MNGFRVVGRFLSLFAIVVAGLVLALLLNLLALLTVLTVALLCDLGEGPLQALQHESGTGPLCWHCDGGVGFYWKSCNV